MVVSSESRARVGKQNFQSGSNVIESDSDNLDRMASVRSHNEELSKKTLLLREVVEFLMWELSAISNRKCEDLSELKKKKGALAAHLRQYDWTPGAEDQEPLNLIMLKSQIFDLEYQSKQKVQVQLQTIRSQIDALQGQKQYLHECCNIYFRPYSEPITTL